MEFFLNKFIMAVVDTLLVLSWVFLVLGFVLKEKMGVVTLIHKMKRVLVL